MALRVVRHIIYYKDYFWDFFLSVDERSKQKIDYVLSLVKTVERIPITFFKYLEGTDGLYEIRIEVGSNIHRIFSCFDGGNLVILFNGFQKKSKKTPRQEIILAEKLKREYFEGRGEKR